MSQEAKQPRLQPLQSRSFSRKRFRLRGEAENISDLREFPIATTVPSLPAVMNDAVLDLYAFLFCQGGFRQLGMTFEQFLLVIATFKPGDLTATIRETVGSRESMAS